MTCKHCDRPLAKTSFLCACTITSDAHSICPNCNSGTTTIAELRAAMLNPLSRERIQQTLRVVAPALFASMPRGEA